MNVLLCFASCIVLVVAELVSVTLVSRHGTRMGNPTIDKICPNEMSNFEAFSAKGVLPGGLTGLGMMELWQLGEWCRDRYVGPHKLLPSKYSSAALYVQASSSARTLQSAAVWGQAMYPKDHGSSPDGFLESQPAPLAVFSYANENDVLIESRLSACKERLASDVAVWDSKHGKELLEQQKELMAKIANICGSSFPSVQPKLGNDLKDITDSWTMDFFDNETRISGLDEDTQYRARQLAVENLFGRTYGTDEQRTYMAGAMPEHIKNGFQSIVDGDSSAARMSAFHVHREQMYAMMFFLGMRMPGREDPVDPLEPRSRSSSLPPASTFLFELHSDAKGGHTVKLLLWTPCERPKEDPGAMPKQCDAVPVQMGDCPMHCPLSEFFDIIDKRIQSTGSFSDICKSSNSTLLYNINLQESPAGHVFMFLPVLFICVLALLALYVQKWRNKTRDYEDI